MQKTIATLFSAAEPQNSTTTTSSSSTNPSTMEWNRTHYCDDDPFSATNSRLADDTVFYAIYPDFAVAPGHGPPHDPSRIADGLYSLHLELLDAVSSFTVDYIWQHDPFTLSVSSVPTPTCPCSSSDVPHLHGHLRFGDNIDDEWFVVFLLFHLSRSYDFLTIRVWDADGDFLLIEAAYHLPRWISPGSNPLSAFIRSGKLHLIPKELVNSVTTTGVALKWLIQSPEESSVASDSVQSAVTKRISDYPERARRNLHRARVRVPVTVAQVLKHEPSSISLAVEGFYDRDVDTMKHAAKMEKFVSVGSGEELVLVTAKMSRVMYAQLKQQRFQPPKTYPALPPRSDTSAYAEAELGMKIACGFEMMYQQRRKDGEEGKGTTWKAFEESLASNCYFQGQLPGSDGYKTLMKNAELYYRKSCLHKRTSDILSAPVRRIDEILGLPHKVDDFTGLEVPPSDDDSWLYSGDEELNAALMERQREMELYEEKKKGKMKAKGKDDDHTSSSRKRGDFDLGDITKSMQAFVDKVSSYEGAEVPQSRNLEEVDFDADRLIKEMETVLRPPPNEDADSDDTDEGSSFDMNFDDSDDGMSDIAEWPEDNEAGGESFMDTYSDVLNKELKTTTLKKSFIRANGQSSADRDEGTSVAVVEEADMDEEFTPVDVDVNLVKSILDSFYSQQGLPGPASSLLGLMGVQLPRDTHKDK
ncbi:hypothetical protein Dimus_017516 [Dionaea muscipula]